MFDDKIGPIEHFSWAKFIVAGKEHSKGGEGRIGKGKDIRVIGTEVSRWKDREGHLLEPAMITGVFDQGIKTLIIGTGMDGMVRCPDRVVEYIKNNDIPEVIIAKTPEACRQYNQLYHAGKKVALLAHGTC